MIKIFNSKGNIFDVIGLVVFVLVLVVFLIGIYIGYSETSDGLQDFQDKVDLPYYNTSIDPFVEQADRFPVWWDSLFVFLMFGFWLVIIIAAYLLNNNPVFLIIFGMLAFAMFIIGLVFEYFLDEFLLNTFLLPYSSSFPMMTWIGSNFFLFSIFFTITMAIALYLKPGGRT